MTSLSYIAINLIFTYTKSIFYLKYISQIMYRYLKLDIISRIQYANYYLLRGFFYSFFFIYMFDIFGIFFILSNIYDYYKKKKKEVLPSGDEKIL